MIEQDFSAEVRFQASGQAALMLIEGMFLDLIEKKVVAAQSLIDTVDAIIDTKRALLEAGAEDEVAACAISMLITIENSLLAAQQSENDE